MRPGKRSKTTHGFTLIELMISLIVMSILIGIFALGSNTMNSTARLSSGIRDLIGLVNFARTRSAINMRAYRMQFCPANQNCILKDKTLQDYAITNPIPRGLAFLEQCATSKVDGTPCGDPGQGQEVKFYNLQKAFRDVEVMSVMHKGETKSRKLLMLYFRTDGSISSCTPSTVGAPTCVDSTYYICLRTTDEVSTSQASRIPRRLEVNFDGRINTFVDSAGLCKP